MSDIPPWIGEPLYPMTHFIGYRPLHVDVDSEPRLFRGWRVGPYVEKAETVAHTFVASWVSIVFLALMSRGAAFAERHVPMVIAGARYMAFQAMWVRLTQGYSLRCRRDAPLRLLVLPAIPTALHHPRQHDLLLDRRRHNEALRPLRQAGTHGSVDAERQPAGGAAAILAATNPEIHALGWWFVPAMLSR